MREVQGEVRAGGSEAGEAQAPFSPPQETALTPEQFDAILSALADSYRERGIEMVVIGHDDLTGT